MGTRFYRGFATPARVIAATVALTMLTSFVGMESANAAAMTAEERARQLAAQQQQEQTAKQQKQTAQQQAQQTVKTKIAAEEASAKPGKATYLRATTSILTTGISQTKLAKGYRYVTLKWKAASNATAYQVYYSYTKDGEYKTKGSVVTGTSKKKMLFKNNKEVFLKVAALRDNVRGDLSESVVIWPGYGDLVNATKIKWSSVSGVLYQGVATKFKVNTAASMLKTYKIKWSSSNKSVAKVSSAGKVTAVATGTAKITARSHAGFKITQTVNVKQVSGSGVPDVIGLNKTQAKQLLTQSGYKVAFKTKFIRKKDLNSKYPGCSFGTAITQSQAKGAGVPKGTTITLAIADEIYDCGVGVEAMVKWAEAVAADDSYGYSMGVYTGRGLDRLCPYTNSGASKDYDCATFVNAALAFSGMGADFMNATKKPSPVVGGVKNLLIKNGWKKVTVSGKKPPVSKLKRGDIVLDVHRHIQIHVGNGKDVGAHNNYDGKSGDSSGREVSVGPSWTGYAEVYRYYGKIGK